MKISGIFKTIKFACVHVLIIQVTALSVEVIRLRGIFSPTQVVRPGYKCLHTLNYLTGPLSLDFYVLTLSFKKQCQLGLVAHAFNPSTLEAEASRSLSSRPAWTTELVPGLLRLHREMAEVGYEDFGRLDVA